MNHPNGVYINVDAQGLNKPSLKEERSPSGRRGTHFKVKIESRLKVSPGAFFQMS